MCKNLIFYSGQIDIRAGGPSGYLANLKKGMELIGNDDIKFVTVEPKQEVDKKKVWLSKLLTFFIPCRNTRKMARLKVLSVLGGDSCNTHMHSHIYQGVAEILDRYEYNSITVHHVRDALFIRNYLKSRKKQTKLLLMSHSPEPPSQEKYAAEKILNVVNAYDNYLKWKDIEKNALLYAADILLFPSQESVEPYSQALEYFDEIIENKEFKFLPTGCCQLLRNEDDKNWREKYSIKTPYVISYIGRHNKIKGYDLLKEIASEILRQRDDVTFLIGGKLSSDIQPLNHPRWIELGFVNPSDILSISDCFILPNRQTYFDLVLLEVMSMGVPVFASATGGNKSVFKDTEAIELYENVDECARKVCAYLDEDSSIKEKRKGKTLQAYYDNYTLEIFAKNYIKMIEGL